MNWIDIFIILVFIYNIYIGLSNGLAKSVLGIGALLAAIFLAPLLQGPATSVIENYFSGHDELTGILGLGVSWFFVYIVLNMIINIILKEMNKTPLKVIDRMAGFIVGIFVSTVIVVIPILIVNAIPVLKEIPQLKTSLRTSLLMPFFEPLGAPFQQIFKVALKEEREEIMEKLRKSDIKELPVQKGESKEEYIKRIMSEYSMDGVGAKSPVPKTQQQKK